MKPPNKKLLGVNVQGPMWFQVLMFPLVLVVEMYVQLRDWLAEVSWVAWFVTIGLLIFCGAGIIIEVTT